MRISVLILKEDKLIAGMISEWLTEKEFEVIGITDKPNEAIRISRLRQPDIAIIDKVLIEGEGLEIARIIKKESPKSHCDHFKTYCQGDGDQSQ